MRVLLWNCGKLKFYNTGPRVQCYKTFYVRNLRMLIISYSGLSPAQSNICGQGQEPTLEKGSSMQQSVQPSSQTLDQTGKACWGQTLSLSRLLRACVNYGCKKSYNIGPISSTFQKRSLQSLQNKLPRTLNKCAHVTFFKIHQFINILQP